MKARMAWGLGFGVWGSAVWSVGLRAKGGMGGHEGTHGLLKYEGTHDLPKYEGTHGLLKYEGTHGLLRTAQTATRRCPRRTCCLSSTGNVSYYTCAFTLLVRSFCVVILIASR